MAGTNTRVHNLSNEHGRTSNGDNLESMPDNSFQTSSVLTGSKEDSYGPRCGRTANARQTDDCSAAKMLSRMRLTLSTKNWQNVETSCAHWASSYMTLSAMKQVARILPAASSSSDMM